MWSDVIVALEAQRKRLEKYGTRTQPCGEPTDTHEAFRASSPHFGSHVCPVAGIVTPPTEQPADLDDDGGGKWEPAPYEARVCLWCFWLMISILAVSALAGWLWPIAE